jgi:predicted RNA binding protein YcfA (HicA-like mRNA interferase family)
MDAAKLVKALGRLGYSITRQTGSHIRPTDDQFQQHHVTIPNHSPIKIGTLHSILTEVAVHLQMSRDDLLRKIEE